MAKIDAKLQGLIDIILANSPYAITKGMETFQALGGIPHHASLDFWLISGTRCEAPKMRSKASMLL